MWDLTDFEMYQQHWQWLNLRPQILFIEHQSLKRQTEKKTRLKTDFIKIFRFAFVSIYFASVVDKNSMKGAAIYVSFNWCRNVPTALAMAQFTSTNIIHWTSVSKITRLKTDYITIFRFAFVSILYPLSRRRFSVVCCFIWLLMRYRLRLKIQMRCFFQAGTTW